ncbi:hypothetical protein ACCS49_34740, partial [Rhizobium brockwellii]|uniref:hypothetical protein n=1 Tax=Rhizobium brockwellii TaxID=3019932 RepID=UPI003F9C9874
LDTVSAVAIFRVGSRRQRAVRSLASSCHAIERHAAVYSQPPKNIARVLDTVSAVAIFRVGSRRQRAVRSLAS